ncbi:MAG: ATP-binding cassette domain-containing protein [Acidobacteria bacterium]|nr:ATP-binding cassette domain-containing protein [Acidobacteriota bacterium]
MSETLIELRAVSKAFGEAQVLDGVDLEVARGETVAILGASGSGKTVTLKTINGLLSPDQGSVEVLGFPVSELEERALVPLRQRVSYLFQWGALFDSMTVAENLAFPILEHRRLSREEVPNRVAELLAMVQLEGIEALYPAELSGGMRKRVALARALALNPEIILYDEPTTGLDPVTARTIAQLIVGLHRHLGVTSVLVTHEISLVNRVAGRVVFLHEGRFIYSGPPSDAAVNGPDTVREFFAAGGGDA